MTEAKSVVDRDISSLAVSFLKSVIEVNPPAGRNTPTKFRFKNRFMATGRESL